MRQVSLLIIFLTLSQISSAQDADAYAFAEDIFNHIKQDDREWVIEQTGDSIDVVHLFTEIKNQMDSDEREDFDKSTDADFVLKVLESVKESARRSLEQIFFEVKEWESIRFKAEEIEIKRAEARKLKFKDTYVVTIPFEDDNYHYQLTIKPIRKSKHRNKYVIISQGILISKEDKNEEPAQTETPAPVIMENIKERTTENFPDPRYDPPPPRKLPFNHIYKSPDQKPEFIGGEDAFMQYLVNGIRYPQEAIRIQAEGKVQIEFVVEKDGSINQVKCVNKVNEFLAEEAIRVIENMPRWKPGMKYGTSVRSYFTVPIEFTLDEDFGRKKKKKRRR